MLKTLLILAFAFTSSTTLANDTTTPENTPAYADAQIMGKCSGLYEVLQVIYEMQRHRDNVKGAITEKTAWKTATKGALEAAGFSRVKVIVNTDSIIETERERLMLIMKSTPKHLNPHINEGLETCGQHQAAKEKYSQPLTNAQ